MKLLITKDDNEIIKRSTNVDLPHLIELAGHEVILSDGRYASDEAVNKMNKIILHRQDEYETYNAILMREDARRLNSRQPEIYLLEKDVCNTLLNELGLNNLKTVHVSSRDDIVNFSENIVLLKPRIGMNSKSKYSFTYIPMAKARLLNQLDNSDIDLSKKEYILQEGITNNRPIIWIGGFVNPSGKIHIDGVLDQVYTLNDNHFKNKNRHPDRHFMNVDEVKLDKLQSHHLEAIEQIKVILAHIKATSTPFCIQAIIDNNNKVNLIDFNFGFAKAYTLKIREKDPDYIIERIKYTYGGVDTITPSTTYFKNTLIPTPAGLTDEIKEYIKDKPIYFGIGQADKDYTFQNGNTTRHVYHKDISGFSVVGTSKEHTLQLIKDFRNFLKLSP